MKDYHEVAENVFRRRDEYEAKKLHRQKIMRKLANSLGIVALVVTLLFSAGTCYVFAVGLGLAEDPLGICDNFFTVPISSKQAALVDIAAVELGDTITCNGISVTAQSALTDGTTALVLLRIEAPADIDLETYGFHFNVDARGIVRGDNPNQWLGGTGLRVTHFPVDDQNDTKNTQDLLLRISTTRTSGSDFSFADGYDRYVMLEGLYAHEADYPYTQYQIAAGNWNFRIRFDDSFCNDERELLNFPITTNCRRALYKVWQTATIHSVVVKGLSMTLRYTYATGAVQEPGDFALTIKVVLTDGTIIDVHSAAGSREDNGVFVSTFLADSPILVDDIDYIQIGETIISAGKTTYQDTEILSRPISVPSHNAAHDITQAAKVHSIITKGFSVTLRYAYDTDAVQEPGYFGDVKVVLTDGTVIKTREDLSALGGNGEFTATFMAAAPILAENIDYIQIGETIIPANQVTHS